jgi:hypothetical protein
VTWRVVLVTASYAVGHALPLLAIAIGSQRLTSGVRVVRAHAHGLRQLAGVVIGLTALAIALDAPARLATAVPGYTRSLQNRIESSAAASRELAELTHARAAPTASGSAPELRGLQSV